MFFPDSGRSYLSKLYDDNWMREYGFIESRGSTPARCRDRRLETQGRPSLPALVTGPADEKVGGAIELMQRYGISHIPVVATSRWIARRGRRLAARAWLLDRVFLNADALSEDVAVAMQPPLPAVDADASIDEVYEGLSGARARSSW